MSWPKIVYNPGTGSVTLTFTYPPVQQEGSPKQAAVRIDNISTDGHRQSALRRIDQFLTVNMNFVALGDVSGWVTFMAYALGGGSFSYYPDASQSTNTTYVLEDTDWSPDWKSTARYAFKFVMRKAVT
jgi:hypothetical protein